MNRGVLETLIGAVVIVVAVVFVVFAFSRADVRSVDGYEVVARFDRIDGLKRGSDVTISGIKVGTVVDQRLDPQTFRAVVRMMISSDVKLPKDTAARLVSESLLGGLTLALEPGGDEENIPPGGEIARTQSAVNLMDLIGQAMFSGTRDSGPGGQGGGGQGGGGQGGSGQGGSGLGGEGLSPKQ